MKYSIRLIINHPQLDKSDEDLWVISTLKVTYEPCKGAYDEFFREEAWHDNKVPGGVMHRKTLFSKSEIKTEWDEKNRFTEKSIKIEVTLRLSGEYGLDIVYGEGELSMTHPVPIKK